MRLSIIHILIIIFGKFYIMKKTILALTLLTLAPISLANSNYVNVTYSNISGSGQYSSVDIDGYTLGYTGVMENITYSLGAGYLEDDYGNDLDVTALSGRIGLNNFDLGTAYVGFSHTNPSEGNSETDLVLGYALVSNSELSYDISYTDTPDPIIAASVRIPQNESTGIILGIADDGDLRQASIGLSLSF